MAKVQLAARCAECGCTQTRWVGRCPDCGAWGTMQEDAAAARSASARATSGGGGAQARPIATVPLEGARRVPTGMAELDRVLGGGFVPGSVTLLGGPPGAGKSTLLLQAADAVAMQPGRTVLYLSAEESTTQVRLRAQRLEALCERLLLASTTDLQAVLALLEEHRPVLAVVDSVQALAHPDVSGAAGGTSQVRECAAALVAAAKRSGTAVVLVGHVTKDGSLAGPRALEHVVDTVLEIDGDRHHALRLLRAVKHRFGAVGEVGCLEMVGEGMRSVADAGRLFLGGALPGTPGIAVTMVLEGHRPLACEIQALVAPSALPAPRRVASGLEASRLHVLAAVLERRAGVPLASADLYCSTVGGLRLTEPAVDLALCLAIASSKTGVAVPHDLVVLGEVGLAGEVRTVAQTERRLVEARRLGFGSALLSPAYDGPDAGLHLKFGRDLGAAVAQVLASPAPGRSGGNAW